jgi:hypothetical protein
MGLFMNYDARKTFQNQEKKTVNMSLEFTPEHEKSYKELSTSVAVALPEIKGKDLVSNFVRLCAVELKFLHSCTACPTPPGSPEIQASQDAGALSSCKAEGESDGNSTHADDCEDDAYGEGDDRGGDRAVHFREQFDPENPLKIDWSGFKYPVPKHIVPRFREAHAIAAMFHLNDELAAKFPVLNCQINAGWQAHYKRPVHMNDILQPPSTGENSYEEEEIEWLQKTERYYVSQMSEEQQEEKGITAAQARRILSGKVTRKLPC